MLRSLLLTSLISLGAGAAAPAPLTNKTNYANNENTPTTYTLPITANAHVTTTTSTLRSDKYSYQAYNEALLIKGNIYIQNTIKSYSNSNQFNIDSILGYNTALYIFQITPYKYLYGNTTNIKLTFTFDDISNDPNDTIKTNIYTYSTKDNWSSYLDLSNYNRASNNRTIIEEITDTENGFLYDKTYKQETINIEDNIDYSSNYYIDYTFNTELTLVNGITNYFCIYIQPEIISNYDTNYDLTKFIMPKTTIMTLNGQMIPPVKNYEVVDLPGTMFYILTMPFTFISTAFNLTLFPGTIYQFNIGNLFLTIIGTLTFLFLIRLLTRNK